MVDQSPAATLPLPLMSNTTNPISTDQTSTDQKKKKTCARYLYDFFGLHDPLFRDNVEILLGLTYFLGFRKDFTDSSYEALAQEFKTEQATIEAITKGFPSLFWNGTIGTVGKGACGLHLRRSKREEKEKDPPVLSVDEIKLLTDFIQKKADDENATLSQVSLNLISLVVAVISALASLVTFFKS